AFCKAPPSEAVAVPTAAKSRATVSVVVVISCLIMRRHPFRYCLGLLPPEIGVSPEKDEESEVDQGPGPTPQVLPECHVGVCAENQRDHLGSHALAHRAQGEERQHKGNQGQLETESAVTDRTH